LDTVTRDGDVVNRKGGFEGGYRDDRISKIFNVTKIREGTKSLDSLQVEQNEIESRALDIEAHMNTILRDLQRVETERNHLRANVNNTTLELTQRIKQHDIGIENLTKRRNVVTAMEKELVVCENQIREYENEMGSEMKTQMSSTERNEILKLSENAQKLQVRTPLSLLASF
jgi:chromosome segregation ATPase